jgi:hypothetical protein
LITVKQISEIFTFNPIWTTLAWKADAVDTDAEAMVVEVGGAGTASVLFKGKILVWSARWERAMRTAWW